MMAEPSLPEKACLACHREDQSNTSPSGPRGEPRTRSLHAYSRTATSTRKNPAAVLDTRGPENDRYRMPPPPAWSWSASGGKTYERSWMR